MILQRLSSGYWFARWSDEVWAQWSGSIITLADFFHNTGTTERIRQCEQAIAASEEGKG